MGSGVGQAGWEGVAGRPPLQQPAANHHLPVTAIPPASPAWRPAWPGLQDGDSPVPAFCSWVQQQEAMGRLQFSVKNGTSPCALRVADAGGSGAGGAGEAAALAEERSEL